MIYIIAHEVRNPLVAAMSACAFVSTTITDDDHNTREDDKQMELLMSLQFAVVVKLKR